MRDRGNVNLEAPQSAQNIVNLFYTVCLWNRLDDCLPSANAGQNLTKHDIGRPTLKAVDSLQQSQQ